jgi:hypothetical protein
MRAIALAVFILCAGCTHVHYGADVNRARVQVNTGNALGAVLLGAMLTAAAVEDSREPHPAYPTFGGWMWNRPAPPLASDRTVSEEDCTKPVELTGNLRCR